MSDLTLPATRPARPVREHIVLAVLLTASFTLAVDFSILNVALPVIGADVGLPLEHLQWIATSFALGAAGFTLLFGRVADLVGRRRMFLLGLGLLGVSSLVGGLAQDAAPLIAARVGQGLATAIVMPAALSLLTTSFGEGPLRDRALGLNGALMAAGSRPARSSAASSPTDSAGGGRSSSTSRWRRSSSPSRRRSCARAGTRAARGSTCRAR